MQSSQSSQSRSAMPQSSASANGGIRLPFFRAVMRPILANTSQPGLGALNSAVKFCPLRTVLSLLESGHFSAVTVALESLQQDYGDKYPAIFERLQSELQNSYQYHSVVEELAHMLLMGEDEKFQQFVTGPARLLVQPTRILVALLRQQPTVIKIEGFLRLFELNVQDYLEALRYHGYNLVDGRVEKQSFDEIASLLPIFTREQAVYYSATECLEWQVNALPEDKRQEFFIQVSLDALEKTRPDVMCWLFTEKRDDFIGEGMVFNEDLLCDLAYQRGYTQENDEEVDPSYFFYRDYLQLYVASVSFPVSQAAHDNFSKLVESYSDSDKYELIAMFMLVDNGAEWCQLTNVSCDQRVVISLVSTLLASYDEDEVFDIFQELSQSDDGFEDYKICDMLSAMPGPRDDIIARVSALFRSADEFSDRFSGTWKFEPNCIQQSKPLPLISPVVQAITESTEQPRAGDASRLAVLHPSYSAPSQQQVRFDQWLIDRNKQVRTVLTETFKSLIIHKQFQQAAQLCKIALADTIVLANESNFIDELHDIALEHFSLIDLVRYDKYMKVFGTTYKITEERLRAINESLDIASTFLEDKTVVYHYIHLTGLTIDQGATALLPLASWKILMSAAMGDKEALLNYFEVDSHNEVWPLAKTLALLFGQGELLSQIPNDIPFSEDSYKYLCQHRRNLESSRSYPAVYSTEAGWLAMNFDDSLISLLHYGVPVPLSDLPVITQRFDMRKLACQGMTIVLPDGTNVVYLADASCFSSFNQAIVQCLQNGRFDDVLRSQFVSLMHLVRNQDDLRAMIVELPDDVVDILISKLKQHTRGAEIVAKFEEDEEAFISLIEETFGGSLSNVG